MNDDATGPHREEFRDNPIDHARVWAGMSVNDLVEEYANAGFGASTISEAVSIYTEMLSRDSVTNFMGLAGAMVPGGMRRVVTDLIRDGYVDALVTTGANLTHDAIEAIGGRHHHGRESGEGPQRVHDEQLRAEEVDRIFNVYLPQEYFADLERHLRANVFPTLERTVSISELTAALGKANADANHQDDVESDSGIAAAAFECDVPIFCPAIQDSVLGLQAWMYSQVSAFSLDALADMTELNDLAANVDDAGALVIGGGVPKNHVLQTMLVVPDAFQFGVQFTMDPERTGGLSGATLDEARSWGKLREGAQNVTVYGDATVTFPLVVAATRERVE